MAFLLNDSVIYANRRTTYFGGTAGSVNNTARGIVKYTDFDFGSSEDYNPATGAWTTPYTGIVRVEAVANTNANVGGAGAVLLIKKNNLGTSNVGEVVRGSANLLSYFTVSAEISVVKGDTLSIHLYNFSGGTQTLAGDDVINRVSFTRVPDFSAGQAIGFGLATDTKHGLVATENIKNIHISPTAAIEGSKIQAAGFAQSGIITDSSQNIGGEKTFGSRIENRAGIGRYTGTGVATTGGPTSTLFTIPTETSTSWILCANFVSGTGSSRCGAALLSTRSDGSVTVLFHFVAGGFTFEAVGNSIRMGAVASGSTTFHYNALRLR